MQANAEAQAEARQPFEAGFYSGLSGDDPRMCPFDKMTREWQEWQRWHGFGIEMLSLQAENERLKSERELFESNGYSRGRRRQAPPNSGSIAPKPRVPAIDIPPVAAQMGD